MYSNSNRYNSINYDDENDYNHVERRNYLNIGKC